MFTDGGMSAADIAAVMKNSGGDFSGNNACFLLLILFLFACNGRQNNNGGGGNTQNIQGEMQRGFDQQATSAGIASLQAQVGAGFADAALATCQGNANTVAAITGAKDALNGTLYANQLANNQQMNSLAMALQNCCCENRAATADLKYTVATEACADRAAVNNGVRDIIENNNANTRAIIDNQNINNKAIMDKLCQLELDGFKQKVTDLQAEVAALRGVNRRDALKADIFANTAA